MLKSIVVYILQLRRLSVSLRLIGSAMLGAPFNLVTRVGLPYFFGTLKDGSLQINGY